MRQSAKRLEFALGVDIGGTFTDLLLVDAASGRFVVSNVAANSRGELVGAERRVDRALDHSEHSAASPGCCAGPSLFCLLRFIWHFVALLDLLSATLQIGAPRGKLSGRAAGRAQRWTPGVAAKSVAGGERDEPARERANCAYGPRFNNCPHADRQHA